MLNIISKAVVSGQISGPQKVVNNLIKGLDILGYPYCINKDLDATSQLWIHDDALAMKEASKRKLKAIIGPNIYILSRKIPKNIDLSNSVYLFPSKWPADMWRDFGFDRCAVDYWPVGIDTEEFFERKEPKDGIVLIYFKQRYAEELEFVKKILEEFNIVYEIIVYGDYMQKEYLEKLKNTKYIIWLGRQESQGIALEEALSMNVPILVWDVLNIGHWTPTNKEKKIFNLEELAYQNTTSAAYFDKRCGIKTKDKNEIKESIVGMEKKWSHFEPRKYIVENLSLEKQAKELVMLFEKHYGVSYELGKKEVLRMSKKWINDRMYFKMFMYIKQKIKIYIKVFKKLQKSLLK